MKRILVTGGSGFIGRNLVEYLQNKYEVEAPSHWELDLTDDIAVGKFLRKGSYDVVVHSANTNMVSATGFDVLNTNLRMFCGLEKHQSEYGKLLYFGSGAEYDRSLMPGMVREQQFGQTAPSDSYGFTKYLMHKMVSQESNIYDLCLFGVYGRYEEWERRFISNNIVRSLKGLPMTLSKDVYFDYLYVADLCRIVEWFIENVPRHRHYNVCTSQPVSLLFLAHLINEITGLNREIVIGEGGQKPEYSGDNTRLLKEMGGFAFTCRKHAVKEVLEYYRDHIDEIDEGRLRM